MLVIVICCQSLSIIVNLFLGDSFRVLIPWVQIFLSCQAYFYGLHSETCMTTRLWQFLFMSHICHMFHGSG